MGEQNTLDEACEQLDWAKDKGINCIDAAELYPVPPRKETQGDTERFLGKWLQKERRDDWVIATKAVIGDSFPYIRTRRKACLEDLTQAVDQSLQRLQLDVIDLYQIHWPERTNNRFGQRGYSSCQDSDEVTSIAETLDALNQLVQAGKIRYFGVSNESPYGILQYELEYTKKPSCYPVISIQNPYSLLNRTYEIGLSEISDKMNIPLLAYSPLAFGVLTGKYLKGSPHSRGRLDQYKYFKRYLTGNSTRAVQEYASIAQKYGISLTAMSLAFIYRQAFVGGTIIGGTNCEQLEENWQAWSLSLDEQCLEEINRVHESIPNPCP